MIAPLARQWIACPEAHYTHRVRLRCLVALLLALLPACLVEPGDALDGGAAARDAAVVDAGPADAATAPAALQDFVEWHMAGGGIRGLAAARIEPDGATSLVLAGEASEGVPIDAHSIFTLASISKTFAAVVAMQLVEEGRLDLDAPIEDALGYPAHHPMAPETPVTARMLLGHVSGLSDDWPLLSVFSTPGADAERSISDFARTYFEDENWIAPPLDRYEYANAGFGVLGAVLEVAAGEDLSARTQRTLLTPLALDGAGYLLSEVDAERLVTGYAFNQRTRAYTPLEQTGVSFYPASTMRISITGLARFLRAFANGGELEGARVLRPESVEELRRVQYESLDARQALGWRWRRLAGADWIGHSGSTLGFSTQMLLRTDGVGIIVLTNSDAYIRSRVGQREGAEAIDAIMERLAQAPP